MSVEWELKQQLDKLIDYAYRDETEETEPKLKFYKYFKVTFANKQTHALALYRVKDQTIEMRIDVRAENTNKYVSLIHELSHHIQYKKYSWWNKERKREYLPNNIKAHGKEFYEIHVKLLEAAFDLGMIDYEDYMNMPKTARCDDKLRKMVQDYEPSIETSHTDKQINGVRVYCYNSFNQKSQLKERGYSYNGQIQAWTKIIENNVQEEKDYLKSIGLKEEDIVIKDANLILDMKPEVSKAQKESTFIIKYDFNKRYTTFTGLYSELAKLLKKNKYLSIKKVKDGESATDLTAQLDEQGLEDMQYEDLVDYCNTHPSTGKKGK